LAFSKKKIVYTVHGFDSIRIAFRKFLPIEKFLSSRASAIVAVSKYDYNNLNTEGIKKNVFTIYNGVFQMPKQDMPSLLELNNSNKTILCIARMNPPKDYSLFEEIAKKLPQYNFVWIGNKSFPPNPPPNVFCLGEKSNASRYYAAVDLCILPSKYEGLPMTIIEAMSYGKPVVASDVGGISEIIINDWNGFSLKNDADLFAEKINFLLQNSDVYNHFSNNTLYKFETELTVQKMVENYYKIYKNLNT
jgi:glycosyltransferase involved in cell wall biosynthesis